MRVSDDQRVWLLWRRTMHEAVNESGSDVERPASSQMQVYLRCFITWYIEGDQWARGQNVLMATVSACLILPTK